MEGGGGVGGPGQVGSRGRSRGCGAESGVRTQELGVPRQVGSWGGSLGASRESGGKLVGSRGSGLGWESQAGVKGPKQVGIQRGSERSGAELGIPRQLGGRAGVEGPGGSRET